MSSTHRKPEGSSGANDSLSVCHLMSLDEISTPTERRQKRTYAVSMGDSDSSLPSPISEQLMSSDLEASGEESDAQRGGSRNAGWTVNRQGHKVTISLQEPGFCRCYSVFTFMMLLKLFIGFTCGFFSKAALK